jgi:hypothetical protein
MTTELKLPELHQTVLTPETVRALFADLEACTEVLAVMPKAGPGYVTPEDIGLKEGEALLAKGALRGLQIRYRYQNEEWWDTLIHRDGQIHITRIQQDFS